MSLYSNAEYFNMLMCLGRSECNYSAARKDYTKRFGEKGAAIPSLGAFQRLHHRVYETGSVHSTDMREGRPRKGKADFGEKVKKLASKDPTQSMRSLAKKLGTNHTKVWRVLNEEGHSRAESQEPAPDNSESRKQYCATILTKIKEDPEFLNCVLFTDECGFQRMGAFDSHNEYVWAENSFDIPNNNHYRWRINVWAGLIGDRVIGPIFVGHTTNGADYLSFLRHQLDGALEDLDVETHRSMWFQHDGSPPHFAGPVRDYLDKIYPGRWIGRGGPIAWPARSQDLSPLDIFWRFVKQMIYTNPLCETEAEMNERIVGAFKQIKSDSGLLQSIREDIVQRYQTCIDVGGGTDKET